MRRLVASALLLGALALPSAARAHSEEYRATRIASAGCPDDETREVVGCRVFEGAHFPDNTPETPVVCAGSQRSPDPRRPWAVDFIRLHVAAATGEGVEGPVELTLRGPATRSVTTRTSMPGTVNVPMRDLPPGTYAITSRFLGAESAAFHGDPPHPYRIIYEKSSSGGTLQVLDCDEFRITLKPTPTTARTGMVFDRGLGRATFFSGSGDCVSSCSDLAFVVRDIAGRPVEGAQVRFTATPFDAAVTANGKGGSGRFCNAQIPNPARCKDVLTLTTNADGRIDGPLRYFPPALLEDAETTLKATVVANGRIGTELRALPVRAGVVYPERTITLGDLDAIALTPSAVMYKDGPDAIQFEDMSKSCDSVKPFFRLPVFAPIKAVCEAVSGVFNPFGAFDKLRLLEVAWFFPRFGLPLEGSFFQDFNTEDTTSALFDAVHEMLRNALTVYGQAFVTQSSITLKLTEVSVPPGKLALRFHGVFRAPNGHAMSTVDTDVTTGYDPSMFLGALADGSGVPAVRQTALRASTAGTAPLALTCVATSGCRGTATLRTPERVLGRTTYRLRGGGAGVVAVPLSATARRLLGRRPAMRVEAVLRARTATGTATQRRTITLRRPVRRR